MICKIKTNIDAAQNVWVRFGSDTALCTVICLFRRYAALAPLAGHTDLAPLITATHQEVAQAVRGQVADTTQLDASSANVDAYLNTVFTNQGPCWICLSDCPSWHQATAKV